MAFVYKKRAHLFLRFRAPLARRGYCGNPNRGIRALGKANPSPLHHGTIFQTVPILGLHRTTDRPLGPR